MLQLWLLEANEWHGYDTYQGFVICAETEAEARLVASNKAADEGPSVWTDPKHSTAEVIAYTTCYAHDDPIVLADFHAG